MLGLTLLATTVLTVATLAILCAVVTRDSALLPATVNPFGTGMVVDPAVDTLQTNCHASSTLAGDWNTKTVKSLREVEDLLDWLENHEVRHTELQMTDNQFVVRWR